MLKYTKFVILFLLLNAATFSAAVEMKLFDKIELDQKKAIIRSTASLQVSEDNWIYLTDLRAGDIKIYNERGEYKATWGRQGAGPNEFLVPFFSHYHNGLLCVSDFGKREIFLLKKQNNPPYLKVMDQFPCQGGLDDIILDTGKVIISGYIADPHGKSYDLYLRDLQNFDSISYLLPVEKKYNCKSYDEYRKKDNNTGFFKTLSRVSYCDIKGNEVYYIWHGDLRIFKINIKTNKTITFGHKTDNYVTPFVTPRMKQARMQRNGKLTAVERSKMSFIMGLFVANDVVCVYYNKPKQQESDAYKMIVQFYSLDGKFLNELSPPGKISSKAFFRKSDSVLFSPYRGEPAAGADPDEDEPIFVLKYKIKK